MKITIFAVRDTETNQLLEVGRTGPGTPHHDAMAVQVTDSGGKLELVKFEVPMQAKLARYPKNLYFIDGSVEVR